MRAAAACYLRRPRPILINSAAGKERTLQETELRRRESQLLTGHLILLGQEHKSNSSHHDALEKGNVQEY